MFAFQLPDAFAHDVTRKDAELIAGREGWQFLIYVWLGAKHMLTGYDHLLFLVGVIFYLRRISHVAIYVSLFALGHTITLITGVVLGLDVNAYLVDAIIGLSVAYKGFDNLGGFKQLLFRAPDDRVAVFVFGLFHGLGLASKLQALELGEDGLVANLLSFNLGVELGQLIALMIIVTMLQALPNSARNSSFGIAVNVGLVVAGFALMSYQIGRFLGA